MNKFYTKTVCAQILSDISFIVKMSARIFKDTSGGFHAIWWSGHVISIKTDQMRGGARPRLNQCAQLGEWMPANHYASKRDATSKIKVHGTSAKRAHLLRELTANIYYSNSAVKYPTCYQNFTLKGEKPVCGRIPFALIVCRSLICNISCV